MFYRSPNLKYNMNIQFYNSLRRKKELFTSLTPNIVTIYTCGLTPQSNAHLGHAVAAIRFNGIRNYLTYLGYEVKYVENVTDIDDKLIIKSKEEGRSVKEIAEDNYNAYRKSLNILGVRPPDFSPKVSQYIDKIIKYIEKLIEKGYAYSTNSGDVYFDIAKKKDYYKLSGRSPDQNIVGTRINVEQNKHNADDFALWKSSDDLDNSWDSPWGKGRPGWHIECSVMANDILGTSIDIHCGGLDLLFPHHENEIAQCEAHNGVNFAQFWLHCGLLNINGEKMSKSLNNFVTIDEGLERYGVEILKWVILKHAYRSTIDLSEKIFLDVINQIVDFYKCFNDDPAVFTTDSLDKVLKTTKVLKLISEVNISLSNDFNTPEVITLLAEALEEARKLQNNNLVDESVALKQVVYFYGKLIGLFNLSSTRVVLEELLKCQQFIFDIPDYYTLSQVERTISEIEEARSMQDYSKADHLRNILTVRGLNLIYEKEGYSWKFLTKITY